MACNAVVYQQAVVLDDEIFKQLAGIPRPKLAEMMASFAKTALPAAANATPYTYYSTTAGVWFNIKTAATGWRVVKVEFANNRLNIISATPDAAVDAEITAAFTAMLRRVAGVHLQSKLLKAAGSIAKVTDAKAAANGALILSLDL